MRNYFLRSLICGFGLGTLFFAMAPLGLGIAFIEVLKPVLTPGISLTQLILGSNGGMLAFFLALVLNGAVFTSVFLIWSMARQNRNSEINS